MLKPRRSKQVAVKNSMLRSRLLLDQTPKKSTSPTARSKTCSGRKMEDARGKTVLRRCGLHEMDDLVKRGHSRKKGQVFD